MKRDPIYFPDLLADLRASLRDLERVRTMSPYDADLLRLKEAIRERVTVLEGHEHIPDAHLFSVAVNY